MATYKIVKLKTGEGRTKGSLRNVINYVGKGNEEINERVFGTAGINISYDCKRAYQEMLQSKEIHNQEIGRQFKHHIQSFKPGEISPELAHKIAIEFAEKNFKNFDVFIATHIDKKHIHNHFIINTVCNKNGLKLDEVSAFTFQKQGETLKEQQIFLGNLKNENDNICRKYNLSIVVEKTKSINMYNSKEYHVYMKGIHNQGECYKLDLYYSIKEISEKAESKKEFIDKMKSKKGIRVIWNETRKHITFKFDDAKKKNIRLANLEKTYQDSFLSKEGLERKFKDNQESREKIKNKTIEFFIKEKGKNTEEIKRYRTYIENSYKLALNKLSKNEYFNVESKLNKLKENLNYEKKERNRTNTLLSIKNYEKDLKAIENTIFKKFSITEIQKAKNEAIRFYENKIEKTVEKNIKILDNISKIKEEFVQKNKIQNTNYKKQIFLLEIENKKMMEIKKKYETLDIPFLALNKATKGMAKKITNNFYELEEKKKEISKKNKGVISALKNSLTIKEVEEEQKKLQREFVELKENSFKNTVQEMEYITKAISQKQEILVQRIILNKETIQSLIPKREKNISAEQNNNVNYGSGGNIKKNDEKSNARGNSYEFDEELAEKKKKKGMGI